MLIALDAMGGDHAPAPIVAGAVQAGLHGPCVLLDVGANINPKPEHLFQYGVMGSILARHLLEKPRPTIALMNVGSEEQKGHDLAREARALYQASRYKEQFVGN